MSSYNRLIMLGNITRDPELSYTPSNTAICKFGIATNRKWKDKDGNGREEVCFVDCAIFGKSAETFNQYMERGSSVLVEGRLQLDRWEDKDGGKRSKHCIAVDNFTFMGGGEKKSEPAKQDSRPAPSGDEIPF